MTFCFDTTRGQEEGQEFEKILYFYPPTTPPNTQKASGEAAFLSQEKQIGDPISLFASDVYSLSCTAQAVVGLTEGLNGFTSLFGKPGSLRSMQSTGKRQIVIEGEKGIWLGIVRAPRRQPRALRRALP